MKLFTKTLMPGDYTDQLNSYLYGSAPETFEEP